MIVEADHEMAQGLAKELRDQGFSPIVALTGQAALEGHANADVVLLNLRLPDLDGFAVCSAIRRTSDVPILAMTARDDEIDCVLSLKLGADDYIARPYRVRELAARVEAVLRRAAVRNTQPADVILDVGPVRVDMTHYRVTVNGIAVTLTPKEFDLLALLAREPGKVFARDCIMREVWKYDDGGDTRTLNVHVASLREKLGLPRLIETVRGVGYRFTSGPQHARGQPLEAGRVARPVRSPRPC
jgi:DNA-binding response OmpR family regulator